MHVAENGLSQVNESSGIFEYQNTVTAFSWFRGVFYLAVYLGAILLQLMQGDFLCLEIWQPVHTVMFVAFLSQLSLIEFAADYRYTRQVVFATLCVDGILLASMMSIFGTNHSVFLFLALICISISSLVLGARAGAMIALLISSLFSLVYAMNYQFDPGGLGAVWLVNNASMLIVTGFSGYMGEQFKFVSSDLETKKEEIRSLTDINELIVDNIPSGLLVINSDYNILRANRGAAKIFSDLSLEGRKLTEVYNDLKEVIADIRASVNSSTIQRLELSYFNYKKEKMILEVIISRINKKTDEHEKFLCLLQNLTEIKNLEFAMQQKEKLAAVGQLAAGIAHEIRNPLASISGSIQLLESSLQTQTPEDKKLLAIVVKEIDRLNRLITEFLDFVRPDTRVEDPININNLAKEVLEMSKLNDKLSKKVEHRTELNAQGIIFGHYDKLKQAVLNIVINGYQAMSDTLRPEIFVQTYDKDGSVVLVIQDNGMGMTKDNLKRIFEPFHTTKAQGTGLGLAITHKIIETHSAEIFIESELGQGSKFSIVFPAGQPPDEDKMYMKKQA